MNNSNVPTRNYLLIGLFAAVLTLSACERTQDDATAQQKLDEGVATAQADASAGMNRASEAVDNATDAVADATITAAVNAELAKDKTLSALKIDVDTTNGNVALKGTAPSEAARDRATMLAYSVNGVVNVDNQLQVRS
jgi:hyperosmotically inducible periplasmic protein